MLISNGSVIQVAVYIQFDIKNYVADTHLQTHSSSRYTTEGEKKPVIKSMYEGYKLNVVKTRGTWRGAHESSRHV